MMIARGMTFPDLSDLLKPIFVERAETDFGLDGKRMTDSRIALLTGLQRRDVRTHRDGKPTEQESARSLPRVVARWSSDKTWLDPEGEPLILTRTGDDLSFDALVASVSRDMHPRTLLDELERQGAVSVDGDHVTLLSESYLPTGDDAKLSYFADNIGDHTEAAVSNLASDDPPYFERAVHYNQLSDDAVNSLEALARKRQHEILKELNIEALRLQKRDAKTGTGNARFRCGVFIYVEKNEEASKP